MLGRQALRLTAPPAPPPAPKQWWNSCDGRGRCRQLHPCTLTMPSMAINRNYKLHWSNSARFMVHASINSLHVTRNKVRNRHHLALYFASCISVCNTLLVLRVLCVERPRRTLGVLVPISGGSRVLRESRSISCRSPSQQSAISEQPAFRKLHTTHLPSSPHTVVQQ